MEPEEVVDKKNGTVKLDLEIFQFVEFQGFKMFVFFDSPIPFFTCLLQEGRGIMDQNKKTFVWAVGTKNPAKLACVKDSVTQCFPEAASHEVLAFTVASGVSDQPMSAAEAIKGAKQRATSALECAVSATNEEKKFDPATTRFFGVGLEG